MNNRISTTPAPPSSFQDGVERWLLECFGQEIASDRTERNHRFLEEALEVVQACGCTQNEAHQLVDYVYARPSGVIAQEIGGAMVTLAGLSSAWRLDMAFCGDGELARVWTKIDKIRAKQAAKPKHSPLPEPAPPSIPEREKVLEALKEAYHAMNSAPLESPSHSFETKWDKALNLVDAAIAALERK